MDFKEFEKAVKFSFNDIIEYQEHSIVSRTILKRETGNVSLFAFDKGEALSEHSAPFDAMVQVADGQGEIIIDGKSHFLNAGETIIMPANIPHAVKAVEKFKMALTMIKSK
ncbi:MAG: cupin domain-containing protein [Bacteroidia bacterium]|nr:cupin domain-containing protein [Bacteroidia bacterium]